MTIREALDLIPHVRRNYGTENFTRDSYTASLWFEIVEKALAEKHQLLEETSTLDICPYYHHELTGEPFCEMEDRRHGKWTLKMNERFYWKECSMCGHKPPRSDEYGTYIESNYCPNCGAKMDGEGSEE